MTNPKNVTISMSINSEQVLELRSKYSDPKIIKEIISASLNDKPIVLFPTSRRHKVHMLNTLMEYKVVKYNPEENSYEFLI